MLLIETVLRSYGLKPEALWTRTMLAMTGASSARGTMIWGFSQAGKLFRVAVMGRRISRVRGLRRYNYNPTSHINSPNCSALFTYLPTPLDPTRVTLSSETEIRLYL